MPCHRECKYHGFLKFTEWCRHPDHLEPLVPSRQFAIISAGGKCKSYIPWEAKVMPGTEPPWPMPVDLQSLFPIQREKPVFSTHGVHKEQTEIINDTCSA